MPHIKSNFLVMGPNVNGWVITRGWNPSMKPMTCMAKFYARLRLTRNPLHPCCFMSGVSHRGRGRQGRARGGGGSPYQWLFFIKSALRIPASVFLSRWDNICSSLSEKIRNMVSIAKSKSWYSVSALELLARMANSSGFKPWKALHFNFPR